jgi:hypothetical protein
VTSALSITSQPTNQTICEGANATFAVTAVGASNYQWQVSTDGGASYTAISGANGASYTVSNASVTLNGNLYRCVVSSSCGNATTNAVSLTVNTLPLFSSSPQSVTICVGASNTFTATASGTGITYQWQQSTTGCAGTWTNISGANAGTYTVSNVTAGMDGYAYRCVASGTCSPAAVSDCATLSVVTSTLVSADPASITVCDGANTSFTVAATGSNVIYQWQINDGSGFSNL